MNKYHVHIYKVVGVVEVDTLASNEIKAREMVIDYVNMNKIKFDKPNCDLIAIEFKEEKKVEAVTSNVLNKVMDIVKAMYILKDVSPDNNLEEDCGGDSLDLVELVMLLEEEFNIEISDVEAATIDTVKKAAMVVETKLEKEK